MKKIAVFFIGMLLVTVVYTQVPSGFSYQAVIRNNSGGALTNQSASIRISLTNQDGTVTYYSETHSVQSNAQGIVNFIVGAGQEQTGTINTAPWNTQSVYLGVEIRVEGAPSYTFMGRQQLQAVPYALVAGSGLQGPPGTNGVSMVWLGSFPSAPSTPNLNEAYYNTFDKKSFVWDGDSWEVVAMDGAQGQPGAQGIPGSQGLPGIQGTPGVDGISLVWLGELDVAPNFPAKNNAYYNTTEKKSFVWDGDSWEIIAKDGMQGLQGLPGIQGVEGPIGPQGLQGSQGSPGPAGPAGVGLKLRGNWSADSSYVEGDYVFSESSSVDTINSMWICQATVGPIATLPKDDGTSWVEFQAPQGPVGATGPQGPMGSQGPAGLNGVSVQWVGSFTTPPDTPALNQVYYNINDKQSYIWDGDSWEIIVKDGQAGVDGVSIQWLGSFSTGSVPTATQINQAYYNETDSMAYIWDGNSWEIIAKDGHDGMDGLSIQWLGTFPALSIPVPTQKNQAYYNETDSVSYIWDGNAWQILTQKGSKGLKGDKGDQGIPGPLVNGVLGQTLVHNGTAWEATSKITVNADTVGIGTANSISKLIVQGDSTALADDPIFEVRNKDGKVVLGVYNEGVRIYVADDPLSKGRKGGFAVGGLTNQVKEEVEYFRVTPDSARFWMRDLPTKGRKGGFAVGGLTNQVKGTPYNLMFIGRDSSRIYIDTATTTKGRKGGFAVGGLTNQVKGAVGRNFFDVAADTSGVVNPSQKRVLWYPLKNAFLTGRVLIESKDSVGENSFASGYESKAKGRYSQAMGYQAIARGDYSTAIGKNAVANSNNSFAFGNMSIAVMTGSFAFGEGVLASSTNSYAFGLGSKATAQSSYAFGNIAQANGNGSFALGESVNAGSVSATNSFAFGKSSTASGGSAYAFGEGVLASSLNSYAFGKGSQAIAQNSYAFGNTAKANGASSFAFGESVTAGSATATYSFAFGKSSTASGGSAYAFGDGVLASNNNSYAFGLGSQATAQSSYAFGNTAKANGLGSFAFGESVTAGSGSASYSFVFGKSSSAMAGSAFAFGNIAQANGTGSFALGESVIAGSASAANSFAFGKSSTASGGSAYAFGEGVLASNLNSYAFGKSSQAVAQNAYAFGNTAKANGTSSFAFGESVTAGSATATYSFAFGKSSSALGASAYAFGDGVSASGVNSYAFGFASQAIAQNSYAFGRKAQANGTGSFALGDSVIAGTATSTNCFAFGKSALATGQASYAFGNNAKAQQFNTFAFGYNSTASAQDAYAFGSSTWATGAASYAFGAGAYASNYGAYAFGPNSKASGNSSIAIGIYAEAAGQYAFSLGYGIKTSGQYSMGIALSDQTGTNITQANTLAIMGGKVGIGTINPSAPFQVNYTGDTPFMLLNTTATTNKRVRLQFGQNGISNWEIGIDPSMNNSDDIYFYNRLTSIMGPVFKNSGYVGIGTSNPGVLLHLYATNASQRIENPGQSSLLFQTFSSSQTGIQYNSGSGSAGLNFKNGNGTSALKLTGDCNVGIGTVVPSTKLHVVPGQVSLTGTTNPYVGVNNGTYQGYFEITSNLLALTYNGAVSLGISALGTVGLGRTPLLNRLEVNGLASKTSAGDWLANSDRRIKTEIKDIGNPFETILKLHPVMFKYTKEYQSTHDGLEDKYYYNFIAQEYQQVFPESVKGSGEFLKGSTEEILQMDSYNAQIVAIRAVQELIKENQKLKSELDLIKQELDLIKKQINK